MSTPTRGIDFSRLSLRDAMDLAILVEEEARDRYQEFAEQLRLHRTAEAAAFFERMSGIEEKHRKALFERRHTVFKDQPTTVNRGMIFDVEAPDFDEARAFMTVSAALTAAMHGEVKAHRFFVEALKHVTDPKARELFEELRDEEVVHQKLVQAELDRLPPESRLKADDFSDEPVSTD